MYIGIFGSELRLWRVYLIYKLRREGLYMKTMFAPPPWENHDACLWLSRAPRISWPTRRSQGCARLMSHESYLTRLWLKWVESELNRSWKSRVLVESESNHTARHLSQSCVNWIMLESKLSHWFFWRENVNILYLSVAKESTKMQLYSTAPPPPDQQLLAKLGKMWWVVSQIWFNSDSNELSRSWVTQEK